MENLRTKIQTTFVERAPNSLTLNNLAKLLQGEDLHAIEKELQKMVSEGVLVERSAGRNKDYLLTSYSGIPVREFVSVGGVKVPRLLHGDTARPEDVNIFFEVLARRVLERLKSYWGNIITLFGAFIGVFSLIVGFIKTAQLDKDATFVSVLSVSTAQILPLALVLGGFIWLLKSQFR
jgi:hypothetical protein